MGSLQGAERLLQFEALEALNAENFKLTDSECVFNFTDLLSDEVTCIGNITAPTVGVTVSSVLTGGNCTDLNIAPPGILTSAITRDNDKVISTVQFALIPVPEVQGEISLTEFCLTTNILYQGIDMLNQKKPITVEFQYDAIGEKVEDKTIFTANAFVCNPDFTPSSKLLSIGSILYVCVRPAEDQITTKIKLVDFFTLEKVGE